MIDDLPRLAYRPKEAAIMLGLSRSTIYQMMADGVIASRKFGAATVIPRDELQRVLDTASFSPATKAAQASIK